MKFLCDTDTVSFFYDAARIPAHRQIQQRFFSLDSDDVLQVSVLTLCEFEYSYFTANAAQQPLIRNTIQKIKQTFQIIALTPAFAGIYGEIKSLLKQSQGRQSKAMKQYNIDLLIASTAVAESSIVVSSDRIYSEIAALYPRFQFQNWII